NTIPFSTNGLITIGVTNQWHFYVMTNDTTFTHAAFGTFLPPNLSIPRIGVETDLNNATRAEADLDVYVSIDPGLTNLEPAVLATADRSLGRGGNEIVILDNAVPGAIYYIGVKAEDQEAAEYSFFGLFSLLPFGQNENNLRFFGFPAPIPDGNPARPGAKQFI